MFGLFKKIGQRAEFEAEMIPVITAIGFPFERIFSIEEQGAHTDGILKILQENNEPFNKFDFTVLSIASLAFRSREIGLEGILNKACCNYIRLHIKELNGFSRGLLEAIENAPSSKS